MILNGSDIIIIYAIRRFSEIKCCTLTHLVYSKYIILYSIYVNNIYVDTRIFLGLGLA